MARKAIQRVDQKGLTKGQLRKLNALKKSVGDDIGAKAFADWLAKEGTTTKGTVDKNADLIGKALEPLVKGGKLTIPWGGYLVKRGKRRVIVTRAQKK